MTLLEKFCTIYIGYYDGKSYNDPILLCVSDNFKIVKYYLKEIRNLSKSQYEIKEVILDIDSAYSLYGDFMLEEFNNEYLYLTSRDIQALNIDIETELNRFDEMYKSLKNYRDFVFNIDKFRQTINVLDQSLNLVYGQLSTTKNMRRLAKEIIANSPITSKNIIDYITHSNIIEEDKELTNLFYKKIHQ